MPRATEADVKKILDAGCAQYDLAPFIGPASRMIDRVVACAATKNVVIDDDTLKDLEIWYSAHLFSVKRPQYTAKKTQDASGEFKTLGYLEQAIALDPTTCLETLTNPKKNATAFWPGTKAVNRTGQADARY
jgi:hypothetical protein